MLLPEVDSKLISSVRIYCKPTYFNRRVERHFSSKMTRKSRDFVFRWNSPASLASFSGVSIYKSIFLIHVLKEQLGDIIFISFAIASGEVIIFYFE
jgi:hypothetical protein